MPYPQLHADVFLSLEEVRDFLGLEVGSQDRELTNALNRVTSDLQGKTGRKIKSQVITNEKYTGSGNARLVTKQAPIVSVQSLKLDPNGVALIEGADQEFVVEDADAGIIALVGGYFSKWPGATVLSYTAGYSSSTLPDELRQSVLEGVAFRYYERENKRWGIKTVDLQTNTATIITGEYPDHVLATWSRYRRGMV